MLTARYSVVCVLLAALFAVVVLCATDVCGEYSAGVPRGGDVDAHGPMHIYPAEKKRWQMRAMLQSEETKEEVTAEEKGHHDSTQVKDLEEVPPGQAKKTEGEPDPGPAAPAPAEKVPQVDVKGPAVDVSTQGSKGEGTGAHPPAAPGAGGGKAGETEDSALAGPGAPADAADKGPGKTGGPAGGGEGEKAAGAVDTKSGKEVLPEQPKDQAAGGGASKTGETTTKGGTETADFAALVRAPLVFFSLLAALACVCVC